MSIKKTGIVPPILMVAGLLLLIAGSLRLLPIDYSFVPGVGCVSVGGLLWVRNGWDD